MSDRSLEDLFDQFRSRGDAAALGRVFDATAPALRRIARHLAQDATDADDLIQGTFLAAIEKRDTFDRTRNLEAWLTGILLKQASLARRARSRVIEPDRLDSRASEDPLDVAGARELSEAMTVALAKLKPADREVLLPLLMDGRRAVEIARELGRRPDTVHMRIHRGLARLRRLLPASFAVGALMRIGHARGLGAIKAEVLRQAHVQLGVASGTGASIAVASWGVVMTTKQIVLAVTVLALSLAVGGYLLVPGVRSAHELDVPSSNVSLDAHEAGTATKTPALAQGEAASESKRAEVQVAASAEARRPVELEVLRSDRRPAAGALVAVVDSTNVLSSAKTDDKGACALAAKDGEADVYVRDEGSLPHHARVEVVAGARRTIELPAGQELSGRLLMIGAEPLPDIELKLSTDTAPEGFATASIDVFKALELIRYDDKDLVARMNVRPGGLFRFQGLPARWSGTLTLPRDLVFADDGNPTQSSKKVFTVGATKLELPVAYRPRILGRLVDSATRMPVVKATMDCFIEWPDGGSMLMGGVATDENGRFAVVLDYRTDAVGLGFQRIRTASGANAQGAKVPSWTGPCEPRDLGDIECTLPASRALEFHVVDLDGLPLAGARAGIRELETATADAKGIGKFPAVPFDAKQMRVVAPGHVLVRVPISKDTESPLLVVLAPANSLTIALPPEAAGRQDLGLTLVSVTPLFGDSSRMYDWILRSEMIGRCWTADGDTGTKEGSVRFTFSPDGRVQVEDVRTGVPFRVQLRGSDSRATSDDDTVLAEVKIESLGPDEHRRIDFTLQDLAHHELRVLRGRAVDDQGQPVLGAKVATCFNCGLWFATTGLDGTFEIEASNRESIDIEISKRGYTPFRLRGRSTADTQPIEALLRRGQDVRVEIVDVRGRPVDSVYMAAEMPVFGSPDIEKLSAGVFNLCDLPDGTVRIVARAAGKSYESSHDTHAGTVRITLPEHGRLEVSWSFNGSMEDAKSWQLALRPVGSDNVAQIEWTPWRDRVTIHTFENVLPGEYTIGLEASSVRNADDTGFVYVPAHTPAHVKVVGGETRTVELHP